MNHTKRAAELLEHVDGDTQDPVSGAHTRLIVAVAHAHATLSIAGSLDAILAILDDRVPVLR